MPEMVASCPLPSPLWKFTASGSRIGQHALLRVLMPYYFLLRLMDHSVIQAVFCRTRLGHVST